jgi:hypothetical protein
MAVPLDGGATYGEATAFSSSASVALSGADGLYTIAVRVTDLAGNTSVIVQKVRLDTSGPAISAALTPSSTGTSYDLGASLTFTSGASDVSGIAWSSARLDGVTWIASSSALDIYSLNAGTHTIVVTAADGAGNVSTRTVTFEVHATVPGLIGAVTRGNSVGLVSSSQASQLTTKLQAAQTALGRGDYATARWYLNAFVTQVQWSGKAIDTVYAARLVNWAQDLLARLP